MLPLASEVRAAAVPVNDQAPRGLLGYARQAHGFDCQRADLLISVTFPLQLFLETCHAEKWRGQGCRVIK